MNVVDTLLKHESSRLYRDKNSYELVATSNVKLIKYISLGIFPASVNFKFFLMFEIC